jgi:flagellar hook-associated protein 2
MSFGVGGLMSGLDTDSIIKQMMTLERRPIVLLQQQEATYQAKISAFGTLKGVLGELQTAAAALKEPALFAGVSASSANTTLLSATASASAQAGSYQVTVSALAQAQQVRSSPFTAGDEAVGTGTLTIQVGDNTAFDVTIDETNNTLAGIAQAINDADTDVTAGVINDGLGNYYLTLASKETGESNTISLTMADADLDNNDAFGLSKIYDAPASQGLFETMAASNAQLTVNGIEVERAGNTVDDLLTGITLTLNEADPAKSFAVTVSPNVSNITAKLKAFVDKYNNALSSLKTLQTSNPEGGTVGPLQGDSTSRLLQSRLQRFLANTVGGVDGAVNNLNALGVTADKDGKLSLDAAVFTAAYESKPEEVVKFFTQSTVGSEGLARQVDSFLNGYLKSTGLLTTKNEGLTKSIEHIGDQVERINFRLEKREENLRRQFEGLELLMGQFQNTSGVLSQQLDALSNLSSQIYKK